jgi:oligopeptide transport system substrate-binding protein
MRVGKTLTTKLQLVLLGVLALLVVACGSGPTSPGAPVADNRPAAFPDKQIFRYPIGNSDFITLDPGLGQYSNSISAIKALFSGLVGLNGKGEVVDLLASSHEVSQDGLTYTFTLRPNLKFSDSRPLTSEDVVYSINRTIDPATQSEVAFYLDLIKGYDDFQAGKVKTLIGSSLLAPDPQTVKIILSRPAGYFLAALTYPSSYTVNKRLIDKYGDKWTDHMEEGGTCGPFKVEAYSHTTGLTAVPDPNYFGEKPRLQKLQFLQSGDTDVAYKAYLSGQFDYAAIPPVNLAEAKTRPDYRSTPELNTWYLALNYLTKPFDNIKIRQAFALAINKDLLNQSVNRGAHKPTNNIIPPGAPGYNPNIKGVDGTTSTAGNPERAKQLFAEGLKEAGYANAAALPPITFTNRNQKLANDIASALVEQWKNVLGVNVKINVLEIAKFNEQLIAAKDNPNGIQMWFAGWGQDYPDPQDWLSVFFAKGVSNDQFNYGQNNSATAAQQQEVQRQLAAADANSDQAARLAAYADAEQKIINDVGWIPLYHRNIHRLINTKVVNYELNGYDNLSPDAWAKVYVVQ